MRARGDRDDTYEFLRSACLEAEPLLAIRVLDKALIQVPEIDGQLHELRGLMYYRLSQYQEAIHEYTAAERANHPPEESLTHDIFLAAWQLFEEAGDRAAKRSAYDVYLDAVSSPDEEHKAQFERALGPDAPPAATAWVGSETYPLIFEAGQFAFVTGDGPDFPSSFEGLLDEEVPVDRLPRLNGAPFASWVVARLKAINGDWFGDLDEGVDGGGYCFEMLVATKDRLIASMQLQGDMQGVALVGYMETKSLSEEITKALALKLLEAPAELGEIRIAIYDPEWEEDPTEYVPRPTEDTQNEYGWDGRDFLGRFNIRERP